MEVAADLSLAALAAALADRPIRTYPALLSTAADALAWARVGVTAGAVVVADYQASPRGRAGLEWRVEQGRGLGFSLVLRPSLPATREGWIYLAATSALAGVIDEGTTISWPDEVHSDGRRAAAIGVETELGPLGVSWAVVNVLIHDAEPPRTDLLRRAVEAIEANVVASADVVLADYRTRCQTLGRAVTARLIPLGPNGVTVSGLAADVAADGALVIATDDGRRVGVRAPHLGVLEEH